MSQPADDQPDLTSAELGRIAQRLEWAAACLRLGEYEKVAFRDDEDARRLAARLDRCASDIRWSMEAASRHAAAPASEPAGDA